MFHCFLPICHCQLLRFSPFLLMKLFNLYLNIILVSKINYLLCKTISFFFFFNQQGFTILGDQESLVQLHTLVSIIGLNKSVLSTSYQLMFFF